MSLDINFYCDSHSIIKFKHKFTCMYLIFCFLYCGPFVLIRVLYLIFNQCTFALRSQSVENSQFLWNVAIFPNIFLPWTQSKIPWKIPGWPSVNFALLLCTHWRYACDCLEVLGHFPKHLDVVELSHFSSMFNHFYMPVVRRDVLCYMACSSVFPSVHVFGVFYL
jgi:hypothetical protein